MTWTGGMLATCDICGKSQSYHSKGWMIVSRSLYLPDLDFCGDCGRTKRGKDLLSLNTKEYNTPASGEEDPDVSAI